MEKKIRIGIFGLGRGLNNAKSMLLNGAEIVAVCDIKHRLRDKAKEQLGDVLSFSDFDEFIKVDMDAVYIANYFPEHAPYAIKALERGIHVISECASNGTMAEGVELVRAAEKSKAIYMLGENYPYKLFNQEMQKMYQSGLLGQVMYAEGEYNHPSKGTDKNTVIELYDSEKHWRCHLPRTYYLTHSLGPLMMATRSTPVRVSATPIFIANTIPESEDKVISGSHNGDRTAIIVTQNDDGSVYRFVGNSSFAAHGSIYRIAGTKGQIENVRGTDGMVNLNFNEWDIPEGYEQHKYYKPEEAEADKWLSSQTGHDGGDYYMFKDFFDCIRCGRRPYLDVYVATHMMSVAILAHRSVLNGGIPYDVPDFRREEDRVKWENDRETPFYTYGTGEPTVRSCSREDFKPAPGRLQRFRDVLAEVDNSN